MGGLRASDLFVEFFLACAFWIFVRFEPTPRAQGAGVALALWLAFYAKLWSLFLYPVVGIHYLLRLVRKRDVRGLVAFLGTSLVLHAAACAFWRVNTGTWVPFLEHLSATYPVPADQLSTLFLEYPRDLRGLGAWKYPSACPTSSSVCWHSRSSGGVFPPSRQEHLASPSIADVWLLWFCLVFFAALSSSRITSLSTAILGAADLPLPGALLFGSTARGEAPRDLGPLSCLRLGLRRIAALGVLLLLVGGMLEAVAWGRSHHARSPRSDRSPDEPPAAGAARDVAGPLLPRAAFAEVCPRSVTRSPSEVYQARTMNVGCRSWSRSSRRAQCW
jgi:hypothetical protein